MLEQGMLDAIGISDPSTVAMIFAIATVAGVVKGVVGFAMPLILISGLSTLISPEIALGVLIIPTMLTNGWQALRQGVAAALRSVRAYKRFLLVGGAVLILCAQAVPHVNTYGLLTLLGLIIASFAAVQLLGWLPKITPSPRSEAIVGVFAGVLGGVSGVWGPPTVAYLTALDTPKKDQVRVQGVIYGLGSIAMAAAHFGSGILNSKTAPVSALLVAPALIGLMIGFAIQDRIDQRLFKRATLIVLFIAGINLVRRGLLG